MFLTLCPLYDNDPETDYDKTVDDKQDKLTDREDDKPNKLTDRQDESHQIRQQAPHLFHPLTYNCHNQSIITVHYSTVQYSTEEYSTVQ